ncbi:phage baseplate assembly protein V, partial [Prevotella fusca]
VGEDGYYRNRFKALPSALEVIPVPDVRIPHAETQMATVTRNDDPRGSGRIQVRMNWQADDMNTNWIRVMTPDGGSSSDVKSNRGFVFIPEVGDHVLVGFRHGDPSRPYAMGSLFNGSTGGGGGKGNNCKSLTTRSGSTLKLDDSTGNVLLADKTGQNLITFDGNNTVTVSSATNIHLDNGKASIKMEGDVITIKANTICIDGATSTTCQSGESDSVVITSGTGVDIKGVDINAIAETNAEISGGSKSVLSSPSTSISGDADVTINGGLVKINS